MIDNHLRFNYPRMYEQIEGDSATGKFKYEWLFFGLECTRYLSDLLGRRVVDDDALEDVFEEIEKRLKGA